MPSGFGILSTDREFVTCGLTFYKMREYYKIQLFKTHYNPLYRHYCGYHCPDHQTSTLLYTDRSTCTFQQYIIRPRRSRSAAACSHKTFPWTICRSVRRSVCPVHCGKTADRIRMPFGIIGRTDPGMRQVVGFGVLLGRIWGAPL